MPAISQMRFLSVVRLNRIIGTLAAELEIQRPLIYLQRLPIVNAFDDELIGRFTGRIIAADLIADDQMATIQESMQIEISTNAAPNIKIGQRLGQKLLNRIAAMEAGNMSVEGQNVLKDWDNNLAENLLLGVRWRMNVLACAMMTDSLTYDRWGIKISNATWGMPANLKVTAGVAWSNPSTATPINDILGMDQVARLAYGIEYDKVTMTTPDFRNMIQTTEFANRASLFTSAMFLLTPAAIETKNDPMMLTLAQKMLGKTIVLDDFQFNTRGNDGTLSVGQRALPIGKVLFSRAQDEGDGNIMDMANAVPTEARVANMIGSIDGLGGEQFGPIAYYSGRADLNPPDMVAWAAAKAFPRKFIPEATAVLTVN